MNLKPQERVSIVKQFLLDQTPVEFRDLKWHEGNQFTLICATSQDVQFLKDCEPVKAVREIQRMGNGIRVVIDLPLELILPLPDRAGYICQQYYAGNRWGWQVTYLEHPNASPVVIAAGRDLMSLESAQGACRVAIYCHREKAGK